MQTAQAKAGLTPEAHARRPMFPDCDTGTLYVQLIWSIAKDPTMRLACSKMSMDNYSTMHR